ncbi:AbrB/MazE/SpoVT family DNA-binding domain-containing protein [Bacillus infantis]|uniref:AbrB/MazE/SpoVT family DNA-binding domain-containing protein n=1 Tax=Bacillus infantis TaxID=324767 RepID=UPI00344CF62E
MKATGMVRKLDELGRLVIPMEVRKTQGLKAGTPIEFFVDDRGIVLRQYQTDEEKKSAITWLEKSLKKAADSKEREAISSALSFIRCS